MLGKLKRKDNSDGERKVELTREEAVQLLEDHKEEMVDTFGAKSINKLVGIAAGGEGKESDFKFAMDLADKYFDLTPIEGERDRERDRIIPKTQLDRGDAEIIGGKGLAYIRLILSDVHRILKWHWCKKYNITVTQFDDNKEMDTALVQGVITQNGEELDTDFDVDFNKLDEQLWVKAAELMAEYPIIFEDLTVGFMLGMISYKRRGRYEFKDIVSPMSRPYDEAAKEKRKKLLDKLERGLSV